jgi:hypothetical protein
LKPPYSKGSPNKNSSTKTEEEKGSNSTVIIGKKDITYVPSHQDTYHKVTLKDSYPSKEAGQELKQGSKLSTVPFKGGVSNSYSSGVSLRR